MAREYLEFAHQLWNELLNPGDLAVDATCGNGHDTLVLAKTGARVIAYDIQQTAIESTRKRTEGFDVQLVRACHSRIDAENIKLLVYNLGYLPGGDKRLTTMRATTLQSLTSSMPKILAGGAITITCYPGHPEGAREKEMLLGHSFRGPDWRVTHQTWSDREGAPSVIVLQRSVHNEAAAANNN